MHFQISNNHNSVNKAKWAHKLRHYQLEQKDNVKSLSLPLILAHDSISNFFFFFFFF